MHKHIKVYDGISLAQCSRIFSSPMFRLLVCLILVEILSRRIRRRELFAIDFTTHEHEEEVTLLLIILDKYCLHNSHELLSSEFRNETRAVIANYGLVMTIQ